MSDPYYDNVEELQNEYERQVSTGLVAKTVNFATWASGYAKYLPPFGVVWHSRMLQEQEKRNLAAKEEYERSLDRLNIETDAVNKLKEKIGDSWKYIGVKKENIDQIIGLPPIAYLDPEYGATKVIQSMPMLEIHPGWPEFAALRELGLNLFTIDLSKGLSKYQQIISTTQNIIGSPLSMPLRVAFEYEGPITDSWSSEYRESEYEEKFNSSIEGIAQTRFITGSESAQEAIKKMEAVKLAGGQLGSTIDAVGDKLLRVGGAIAGAGESITNSMLPGAGQSMSGSKTDFPLIFSSSTYKPEYSITIKLYNPDPTNFDMFVKHIVKPIAHLMAFVTPLTDSPYTYSFPVLCQVNCPGLFAVKCGYVSNMEISKGVNADVTMHQTPNQVDVRMTFTSLYSTMVGMTPGSGASIVTQDRPTLSEYAVNLSERWSTPIPTELEAGITDTLTRRDIDPVQMVRNFYTPPGDEISYLRTDSYSDTIARSIADTNAGKIDAATGTYTDQFGNQKGVADGQDVIRSQNYNKELEANDGLDASEKIALKIKHNMYLTESDVMYIDRNPEEFAIADGEFTKTKGFLAEGINGGDSQPIRYLDGDGNVQQMQMTARELGMGQTNEVTAISRSIDGGTTNMISKDTFTETPSFSNYF